jgi:NADH-quinone oxidoreductase subunit J
MLSQLTFWAASAVAILATLMVLFSRNPFYAVLYLIISLFGVSLIFYTLGSSFLAVLEIIVYAGAIMVLFLFVVQMLSPGVGPNQQEDLKRPALAEVLIPGLLAAILLIFTGLALFRTGHLVPQGGALYDAKALGIAMFDKHYLGVELASLILLIGIVGGMHLGRAAALDKEEEVPGGPR